jgi:hypothetical protein
MKRKLLQGSIDVNDWRDTYRALVRRLGSTPVIEALVSEDAYYDSKNGYNDYKSLQKGAAGLGKTIKGVETLESYLNKLKAPSISTPRYLKDLKV